MAAPAVSRPRTLLAGSVAALPFLLGMVPFGLVTGLSSVVVGLNAFDAVAMSVVVFAGASQLAGLQLVGVGAPLAVIALTTLMINLRFALYSASLTSMLGHLSAPRRLLAAYLVTDPAFALAARRFDEGLPREARFAYYLGAAGTLWVGWTLATAAGALLGAELPAGLSLEFAIPLAFLAMLVGTLTDRPTLVAALAGAGLALLGRPLPYNLGLVLAALGGVAAGALAEAASRAAPRRGTGRR